MISYQWEKPELAELIDLYQAVGWNAYTQEPNNLAEAVRNSTAVLTARMDTQLVGLCRILTDQKTILYVQDVLVDPNFQDQGIGTALLQKVLNKYPVRQNVLITDDETKTKAFYEKAGFKQTTELGIVAFYHG